LVTLFRAVEVTIVSALFVGGLVLAAGSASAAPQHRLPANYQWGRCLLVVDGQTRISGKCAYHISKGGDFHIDGPHQIYDGIDYPTTHMTAEERSADYWADVFKDGPEWTGYANSDIRAVHGDPSFGVLHREGACYVNSKARVCLWQK
jgi:hypothetical protein